MCTELLRFSSAEHVLKKIPEEDQNHHRVKSTAPSSAKPSTAVVPSHRRAAAKKPAPAEVDLWEDWGTSAW